MFFGKLTTAIKCVPLGAVAPEPVINTSHAEQSDLQIFGNFEYDRFETCNTVPVTRRTRFAALPKICPYGGGAARKRRSPTSLSILFALLTILAETEGSIDWSS